MKYPAGTVLIDPWRIGSSFYLYSMIVDDDGFPSVQHYFEIGNKYSWYFDDRAYVVYSEAFSSE